MKYASVCLVLSVFVPALGWSAEGKHLEADGTRIYYEVHGDGPPLLLIHGGFATIESWAPQIPALSQEFQVIAIENRGHGRTPDSDKPFSYQLFADDAVRLCEHLGVASAHVVGMSDGGIVGLELAQRYPQRVQKLVVIGANFHTEGLSDGMLALVRHTTPETVPPVLAEPYKRLSPDGAEHFPVVFEKLKSMWLKEPNYRETDLGKIETPTLVMVGDRDEAVRREHTLRLFDAIPGAQLSIIPGGTHGVTAEKPALVNRVIMDFLD